MTLDEAIQYCEEAVEKYKKAIDTEVDSIRKINFVKCLIDFYQILEWLKSGNLSVGRFVLGMKYFLFILIYRELLQKYMMD